MKHENLSDFIDLPLLNFVRNLYIYMVKGFNTDINYNGMRYHIQTEDWGEENPYLVSRVFQNGAVLKSLKIHHNEVLPVDLIDKQKTISFIMKVQHDKILDLLTSGQLI